MSSSLTESPNTIEELDWYHDVANRHIAESLLMQNGEDGSYLVRPSSNAGTYTLSVRAKDSVKHYPVIIDKNEIQFGMAKFQTMAKFLEHFKNQPLLAGESGVVTVLKYPYPKVVAEPAQYETVRVHAQMGGEKMAANEQSLHLANASKEGFLTKQGGFIRNWKCRWCVLQKMNLKYYRHRADPDPVRILDLRECTECVQDTTQGQENCFRLVFPWRTFYLSAATESETLEWIQIIQWKLKLQKRGTL